MTEGATAGEDGILTLFEAFRGELEASNGVREEIKLVTQNMDAETRKMQAALMAIHSGTDQAGKRDYGRGRKADAKQARGAVLISAVFLIANLTADVESGTWWCDLVVPPLNCWGKMGLQHFASCSL
jgi:hypothetical protein